VGGGCGGGANQSIALIVAGTFGYARHPRRPGRIVSTLTESKTTLVAGRVPRLLAGGPHRVGSVIRRSLDSVRSETLADHRLLAAGKSWCKAEPSRNRRRRCQRNAKIVAKAKTLKTTADTNVITMKVTLAGVRPPIWRRLVVPASMTLGDLHQAILGVMGWHGGHLHTFHVGGKTYGDPSTWTT